MPFFPLLMATGQWSSLTCFRGVASLFFFSSLGFCCLLGFFWQTVALQKWLGWAVHSLFPTQVIHHYVSWWGDGAPTDVLIRVSKLGWQVNKQAWRTHLVRLMVLNKASCKIKAAFGSLGEGSRWGHPGCAEGPALLCGWTYRSSGVCVGCLSCTVRSSEVQWVLRCSEFPAVLHSLFVQSWCPRKCASGARLSRGLRRCLMQKPSLWASRRLGGLYPAPRHLWRVPEPSIGKVLLTQQESPLFPLHTAFMRINTCSLRHEVSCWSFIEGQVN